MKKFLFLLVIVAFAVSCKKADDSNPPGSTTNPVAPTVSTTAIANTTPTSAESGGNVSADGGAPVAAKGVCWSLTTLPTISDNKTTDGTGTGSFNSSITGLTANTTYYVRAYATNTKGTSYGSELSFKTAPIQAPVISTSVATNIKQVSAQSGGNISSDGGAAVTARGICWNTSPNPTIANNKTTNATGTGSFISTLTPLNPNTTYYVRAYATNTAGTTYGTQITITTLALSIAGAGVTDVEGNTYTTVILADKEWMAQNLRTAKYRNGDVIPNVTDNALWDNITLGAAWCYYNNTAGYNSTYGKLYSRLAVVDVRQLCPTGWHVPSWGEWAALSGYLGGDLVSGGALKETGPANWVSPNTGANNISGFNALPGGYRGGNNGRSYELGQTGLWYVTDGAQGFSRNHVQLVNDKANIIFSSAYSSSGFSVRCVKD